MGFLIIVIIFLFLGYYLTQYLDGDAPYEVAPIKYEEKEPKDLEEGDYFAFRSLIAQGAVKAKVLSRTGNNICFEVIKGYPPYRDDEMGIFTVFNLSLKERCFVYLGI